MSAAGVCGCGWRWPDAGGGAAPPLIARPSIRLSIADPSPHSSSFALLIALLPFPARNSRLLVHLRFVDRTDIRLVVFKVCFGIEEIAREFEDKEEINICRRACQAAVRIAVHVPINNYSTCVKEPCCARRRQSRRHVRRCVRRHCPRAAEHSHRRPAARGNAQKTVPPTKVPGSA